MEIAVDIRTNPNGHVHYCNSNNLIVRKMSSETYYVCVCVCEASFHQFIISKLQPKAKKRKTKDDLYEHTGNYDEERGIYFAVSCNRNLLC
jgi:hypothetical protein